MGERAIFDLILDWIEPSYLYCGLTSFKWSRHYLAQEYMLNLHGVAVVIDGVMSRAL